MTAERAPVIDHETGEILSEDGGVSPISILDVYAPGGRRDAPAGADWLATISAGFLDDRGYPHASDKIEIDDPRGRAPGLRARVEAGGGRRLGIALAFDDPSQFLHQAFACYSRTRLLAYGDPLSMTEFVEVDGHPGGRPVYEHRVHPVGTDGYERVRAACKVSWSLFFVLAEWDGERARIDWPDEFGVYRLRSGGRHSLASVVGSIDRIRALTRGRLRGIPLELRLDQWDVAGPDGVTRRVPVFTIGLKPPSGLALDSGSINTILGGALAVGAQEVRALVAPIETLEMAAAEAAPIDEEAEDPGPSDEPAVSDGPAVSPTLTDEEMARIEFGDVACDVAHYRRTYHATVQESPLAGARERAAFIREISGGQTDSLSAYLSTATEGQASKLIAVAASRVAEWRRSQAPFDSLGWAPTPDAETPSTRRGARAAPSPPPPPPGAGVTSVAGLATAAQITAIEEIGRRQQLTRPQLDGLAEVKFGRPSLGELAEEEASELISALQPGERP